MQEFRTLHDLFEFRHLLMVCILARYIAEVLSAYDVGICYKVNLVIHSQRSVRMCTRAHQVNHRLRPYALR